GSRRSWSVLRPAAFCGVVGLKPTYGRVSRRGVVPLSWSLDHVGVFARSVADAALVMSAAAGYDPAAPGAGGAVCPPRRGAAGPRRAAAAPAEAGAHRGAVSRAGDARGPIPSRRRR